MSDKIQVRDDDPLYGNRGGCLTVLLAIVIALPGLAAWLALA